MDLIYWSVSSSSIFLYYSRTSIVESTRTDNQDDSFFKHYQKLLIWTLIIGQFVHQVLLHYSRTSIVESTRTDNQDDRFFKHYQKRGGIEHDGT